jgi:hypothetical protein
MDKKTMMYLVGGAAIILIAPTVIKWLKHESAEMKREEEAKEAMKSFTADESKFMNYVDEGFMGFTASDEFMMLGGGSKPIEFANADGKIPVATDEPNFANIFGYEYKQGQGWIRVKNRRAKGVRVED